MMGGCVQSRLLFIVLARNEHGDLPHAKKNTNESRACIVPPQKKRRIVEPTDYTKRAHKLFKRPHTQRCQRPETTKAGFVEPTERDCFVQCGIHIVANSGGEVVFHLGETAGHALTEIVVYWGSRFTAPRDGQLFID